MNTQFNFKQRALKLALASAFVMGATTSGHSLAATVSADGTATVVVAMGITKNNNLEFGKFAAGTGGTVVMTAASARSKTGGITLSSMDAGRAASFAVTGDGASTYAITLPSSAVTITHATDTTKTMTIDTFTSNPSGTGTLTNGAQTLLVGGTLNVASAQTTGGYTGAFSVSVDYN
jgi:hypothetical protein